MHTPSFGALMATTPEVTKIGELFTKLGLSQLISKPTNFEPHKNPACIDAFRIECQQAVETAKLPYLTNLANKVNNPGTSQNSYRKVVNRVTNKYRAPKIPPLLANNLFILNCREKARYFNDYFSQHCNPVINNSVLPILRFLANKRIDHVPIDNDEIISLIRKLNPNKATGSDGISGQMLLSCDESVTSSNNLKIYSVNLYIPRYVETCKCDSDL